jgi:putative SOS response-associated peptidase YedK
VAIVRARADGERELTMVGWGLVPHWADDPGIGQKLINARSETLRSKPAFRESFRRRRCLVPADGFYEWHRDPGRKQPFHITLADGSLFCMAGLWDTWRRDGLSVETCTIITTTANDLLRPLHERMPVIVPPQGYADWLDPVEESPDALERWLRSYPAERMAIRPVAAWVNKAAHEGPDCLEAPDSSTEPIQRSFDFDAT